MVVQTLKELHALKNHVQGEFSHCLENDKIYQYADGEWKEYDYENTAILKDAKDLSINLYELNQSSMQQFEVLTDEELHERAQIFVDLINKTQNEHYMLLCKEYNYYTIFEKNNTKYEGNFQNMVEEIIKSLGDVISIDFIDENNVEIWIRIENENHLFFLFPYDLGVVYYE